MKITIFKQGQNRSMMSTSSLEICSYSKKSVLVRLLNSEKSRWHKLMTKIGGSWNNSSSDPGWLVPKDNVDLLDDIIHEYGSRKKHSRKSLKSKKVERDDRYADEDKKHSRGSRKEEDDDKTDSSGSESSDDELIQKVLARKLMSESSHKVIDTEDVDNSDLEDIVSYSRRMRHIYSVLKDLRSRVHYLESQVAKMSLPN